MTSSEARLGAAVSALTTLLDQAGVEDPARKASDFMTELLKEGWRAVAQAGYKRDPEKHAHPNTAAREAAVAREQIREERARFAAREEARRLAQTEPTPEESPS